MKNKLRSTHEISLSMSEMKACSGGLLIGGGFILFMTGLSFLFAELIDKSRPKVSKMIKLKRRL